MTQQLKTQLVSSIAAAAAIALLPTGVAAQTAQPTTTVPDTSATPSTTTSTPDAAPVESQPAPPDSTATDSAPAPAVATVSTTTATRTEAHRSAVVPVRHAAAAAPAHATRTVAAPASHSAALAAPAKSASKAVPAAAAAAPAIGPAVAPPPPVMARPAAAPASRATSNADWELPAAITAIVIALAIGGIILSRRRRRAVEPEPVWYDEEPPAEAEPEVALAAAEPAFVKNREEPGWQPTVVTPAITTAAIRGPALESEQPADAALPSGFDISRFGRHVQQAYRGPTPDNPSLSLRHRLRRAAALDQMERRQAAERGATEPRSAEPAAESAGFMFPQQARETERIEEQQQA